MIGYNTELQLTDYALARGVTLAQPENVLLTRALDWLELQPFAGEKTDPEQPLEFPRNGSETVPEKIKTAQLVAAMIYNAGGDPLQAISSTRVLSERVEGAVAVTYSDNAPLVTLYPQLVALLRDYVGGMGGNRFAIGAA